MVVLGSEIWSPRVLVRFLSLHQHDQEAGWGGRDLLSSHFHMAAHHHSDVSWTDSGTEARPVEDTDVMFRGHK